jgi:hypothetical protein
MPSLNLLEFAHHVVARKSHGVLGLLGRSSSDWYFNPDFEVSLKFHDETSEWSDISDSEPISFETTTNINHEQTYPSPTRTILFYQTAQS